jgi:GrpB-like predicted nucleotidyltransferase (UPF0157 family)
MPTFEESVAAGGRQVGPDRHDPVAIVEYDPAWPDVFEQMRNMLAEALGAIAVRIEHVGSTAIPGLPAKPVVDIQVSVPDIDDDDAYREPIESLGFVLRWIETGHRYFRPPPRLPRTWQVHVCQSGGDWERVHLLFRDYMRAHPMVAFEYGQLKMRLAGNYRTDRIRYTDEKGPFIDAVLEAAEDWARESGWRAG